MIIMSGNVLKSVFTVLLLSLVCTIHAQTTYGDTIFYDSFGQHITRVTTPYMPGGSYVFADPNGTSAAKEIQDNYYAVIDPRHIVDAGQSSYYWTSTSPTSFIPTGARPYYTTDHTGDTNGAVMVVNAGTTINYLYKRDLALKTGFRYRFSFWIYVVARSSQFSMEVVNSTNNTNKTFTGPVLNTEGVWTQYTLDFPVPLSSTNVTNNVSTGLQNKYSLVMGNDYYIDDILLSTLHTDPVTVSASSNGPVCEGTGISLHSIVGGGAPPFTYSWSGPNGYASTDQLPTILNSSQNMDGLYTVTVTDAIGQIASASVDVIVISTPKSDIKLSTEKIDSRNNEVSMTSLSESGINYKWDFGDGSTDDQPTTKHAYQITGSTAEFTVKLTATNSTGCTSSSVKTIEVIPFIPNVFSPNGDGINDVFMNGFDIHIFDRYGLQLYSGSSGWDGTYNGKKMDNDTYFYEVRYLDRNKNTQIKKGYITLKR
ncbi:PKD domain containing protein [Paludibacter propionicigenes WB4]|uniref:PKD domain containing protein n=1 Tax=Paludibacter propionicigenes (strain DSM 17365 / JCM 13257 / WB4) TaxID=694427 RepID=E4T6Z7_PALPW|nr:T9SS type B sorting domain-containing protein [Paludibacter propionicigenes]ADQ80491.1 PKD domain containing protein [Paludibacter propionicigenes WB4]